MGRTRCRCRNCSVCGPWLKGCHVAHFVEAFRDRDGLIAFSGSLDPGSVTGSYRQRADLLGEVLSGFVYNAKRWLGRHGGAEMVYLATIEADGNGHPHFHALISFPLEDGHDALELLRARWFKQGGGIVMKAEPLMGGEEGLARYIGYVLKEQFGPGIQGHRIRASHSIGYNSEAAKERRRAFVEPDEGDAEGVVLDPRFDLDGECDGGSRDEEADRAREPLGPARLDLSRRKRRYVEWLRGEGSNAGAPGATRYGVRVIAGVDDTLRYDVVRSAGSPGADGALWVTLSSDLGSMSRAEAEARSLAAVAAARQQEDTEGLRFNGPNSDETGSSDGEVTA